jgi:hypothetical protein
MRNAIRLWTLVSATLWTAALLPAQATDSRAPLVPAKSPGISTEVKGAVCRGGVVTPDSLWGSLSGLDLHCQGAPTVLCGTQDR